MMVMLVQLCEYPENPWIVYFKMMNFILYELHLNETIIKKEIYQLEKM